MATLLNCDIVEEVHFMRKLVIDGSNTSGFQRTSVVALDGHLETEKGRVGIPTICLEEEAARKIRTQGKVTTYRLDRLGIPLVEITTAPDIKTPEQALEVARQIGDLLRATGRVKRGIGTIRQDINISIPGGARVEIKGVQELNSIPEIIRGEVKRQEGLIKAQDELEKRGIEGKHLPFEPADVTGIFKESDSKIIARQIKKGGKVLALKLPGFKGLLKGRLGPELAGYARVRAGVGGIFHTDELPAYGITEDEVEAVWQELGREDRAAFVLVVEREKKAGKALEAVRERALMALEGVPEETRMAKPDGTTAYMRPLPGAARMYPETDVPPVVITGERLERIKQNLPELREEKIKRFEKDYDLNHEIASQITASSIIFTDATVVTLPAYATKKDLMTGPNLMASDLLELIMEKLKRKNPKLPSDLPKIVANTITNTVRDLHREGYNPYIIPVKSYVDLFQMISQGKIAKEAIPEVITKLAEDPGSTVEQAIEDLGLSGFGEEEVAEIVRRVLKERADFAREKGMDALKPLMGPVMKEVRGRVDGGVVARILGEELRRFLE
jgi:glutamyl-tRNA(Gln) amidotransferase subunit E